MLKLRSVLIFLMVAAVMTLNISANDVIAPDLEIQNYEIQPYALSNEITASYDTPYIYGNYGHGVRYYNPGGLFTNARADTEVWGSASLALADQTSYCYVYMINTNDGCYDELIADPMDANRYAGASITIDSNYATNIRHTASLYVNGAIDFNMTISVP